MNRLLLDQLPPLASAALTATLQPNETLRWTAPMNPRHMALKMIPLMLFGIFWTGFSVFWMWGASGFGEVDVLGGLFALFGLPFVLIGIGMLLSPFYNRWMATRSGYAITDRRAIILECGWRMKIIEVPHAGANPLEVTYNQDGTTTLLLDRRYGTDSKGRRTTTYIKFYGVANGKTAETLLRELRTLPT